MSFRSDAVNEAIREWERYPEGRKALYYQETGGEPGTDWCGMFVLRSLQKAGLAKGVRWIQGIGFIAPLKLPMVSAPMPGDIVVVPQPFQHQAMVVSYEPATGMVTSIDGNQPGIEPRVRFVQNGNIQFYSIQPLVEEAERNQSTVGYLVMGAIVAGAAAWVWENGLPKPIERVIKRLAA